MPSKSKSFFSRYYGVLLAIILCVAFTTRIFKLYEPPIYIFDEVYHGITAKLIARNDPRAFEWWNQPVEPNTAVDWLHPPLAKYTQAIGIKILGENSFGWRVSSAITGVLVIWLTARVALELFNNRTLSLTAATLATLDGLLLTQSRIAMNDIHVTAAILITVWGYLEYRKHPSLKRWSFVAVLAGIAAATKWSGFFIALAVCFIEFLVLSKQVITNHKSKVSLKEATLPLFTFIAKGILFAAIVAGIYVTSYSFMFSQGKDLTHFVDLHKQIWWYQTNLSATHTYQSRPLQWFLNLRPVWYHVDRDVPGKIANIYAFGNPILFWTGAVAAVSTALWLAISALRKPSKLSQLHFHVFILSVCYWIVWLPWQLSPRIMFFYHYTPAVPFLCILIAFWFQQMWNIKVFKLQVGEVLVLYLTILIAATFCIWYPNWTAIPVPTSFADAVYFILPSWQ